jgi:hypothetical protein
MGVDDDGDEEILIPIASNRHQAARRTSAPV